MTQACERFQRSFSDEELIAFVRDRAAASPPYWKLMRLALRIEAGRRGLHLVDEVLAQTEADEVDAGASVGTA
jgi:hypothetical protein